MISTAPLNALLVKKGITLSALESLTGISHAVFLQMKKGNSITPKNIEAICSVLNCQPYEVIEFQKTTKKGHWEWINAVT